MPLRRLGLLVAVLLVLSPAAAHAAGHRLSFDRSVIDRLDDVSGPQYHLVYVIPADGTDHGYDTDGSVAKSWLHFEGWLAGQTGGRVYRTDTLAGAPDVSFLRLKESGGEVQNFGTVLFAAIGNEFAPGGQTATGKKDVFYYDGPTGDPGFCGRAGLGGSYGVVYLQQPCGNGLPAINADFAAGHEATHEAGAVAKCAPHYDGTSHVADAHDLMSGIGHGIDFSLDPGHDDYYGENVPVGCFNLATSPLLTNQPLSLLTAVTISLTGGTNVGTVTVGSAGSCMSSANPTSCMFYVASGTPITLTATPAPGLKLMQWFGVGACSNPCTITPTGDITATADIGAAPTAYLNIMIGGKGTVTFAGKTCMTTCSGSVEDGSQVTFTATPAPGWHFVSWTEASCSEATCTITVNKVLNIHANFAPDAYSLTVVVAGKGKVRLGGLGLCTDQCSFRVTPDTVVTLMAHPAAGWRFTTWTGAYGRDCYYSVAKCIWTSTRDWTLRARFDPLPKAKPKAKAKHP